MTLDPAIKRVPVVGTTGCGKTTMAERLAPIVGATHIELDRMHWGPNWTIREDFMDNVKAALEENDAWIIEGGYNEVAELTWPKAHLIVWLDYPFMQIFLQLLRRTLWRCLTRELVYGINRESLYTHFCTRDSLFLWLFQTFRQRRRDYQEFSDRYPEVPVYRFRSRKESDAWLDEIAGG